MFILNINFTGNVTFVLLEKKGISRDIVCWCYNLGLLRRRTHPLATEGLFEVSYIFIHGF